MNKRFFTVLQLATMTVLLHGVPGDFCSGQETAADSLAVSSSQYRVIFDDIANGISTGDVTILARHFGPQVSLNLRGDESGTFSSKQSFYVLKSFFKVRRFSHFVFSKIEEPDANPYATGNAELIYKGTRETIQVYVALTSAGDKYVIAQLTIY